MNATARILEGAVRAGLARWRRLSLDAKVVALLGLGNWVLLLRSLTVLQVTRDGPIWQLFPDLAGPLWLFAVGAIGLAYPLRDLRGRARFGDASRWRHLALLVAILVVLPTLAEMVLRATGKPYTFIHDGALMAEEAARKLLAGQNPYSADYLDTPLFYWPMVNNPALYHFTYFPLLFLVTIPPLLLLAPLGVFDERVLFLPGFIGCLVVAALLVRSSNKTRLAAVAALALNPYLFEYVIEGRNDAFVLLFVLLTFLCLQLERKTLAGLALAAAAGLKLHAVVLVPFVFAYLLARARPRSVREAWRAVTPAAVPFAVASAVVFVPFLVWDAYAFWDDVVLYNAGASAWSYPVSGIGFSSLLLWLGVIPYRAAEFPLWIFEVAAAVPVAVIAIRRLAADPTLPRVAYGYALTLLAFLFFGRYFQPSYLGYIAAAVTPALFIAAERTRPALSLTRAAPAAAPPAAGMSTAGMPAPVAVPAGLAAPSASVAIVADAAHEP